MKYLNQDSRSSGRDLNPGPPEHEVGLLTTQSRRSVKYDIKTDVTEPVTV
jgi:hypothetical protein